MNEVQSEVPSRGFNLVEQAEWIAGWVVEALQTIERQTLRDPD